jgi:hypothetical protein
MTEPIVFVSLVPSLDAMSLLLQSLSQSEAGEGEETSPGS